MVSHRTCRIPLAASCNRTYEVLSTRETYYSMPKVFIGDCLRRHLLLGIYKNWKAGNHIVCTNNLGTVTHLS